MRVGVEAYGCTMSMGEGEHLRRELAAMGHDLVESDEADLVVINTCMVIQPTENRMLRRIRDLSSSGKKVVVGGCLAVMGADRINDVDPDAVIMPFHRYPQFREIVRESIGDGGRPNAPARGIVEIVPVAQGCRGNCSYCVTRLARGGLVSRQPSDILSDVKRAVHNGSREIQVTAQDTASYGSDIGTDLAALVRSISMVPGDFRVRVGMMNTDGLKGMMEEYMDSWRSPKVYRFLHLPVQSGSDGVLSRMRRKYTVDDFLSIVERFRSTFPDMTLSTDLITGFPHETEEDHLQSLDLVRRVRPDIVNITRFSARPGTDAFNMEGQVHGRIAKERSRELTDLRFSISEENNLARVGTVENVLITERGKEGTVVGRTGSYRPVVLRDDLTLGTFATVELTEAAPTHLFGKVL